MQRPPVQMHRVTVRQSILAQVFHIDEDSGRNRRIRGYIQCSTRHPTFFIDAYELGRIGMDDNCIDHNVLTL
ncbi:hypothetical protein D3C78_1220370 [compost metagenome]